MWVLKEAALEELGRGWTAVQEGGRLRSKHCPEVLCACREPSDPAWLSAEVSLRECWPFSQEHLCLGQENLAGVKAVVTLLVDCPWQSQDVLNKRPSEGHMPGAGLADHQNPGHCYS